MNWDLKANQHLIHGAVEYSIITGSSVRTEGFIEKIKDKIINSCMLCWQVSVKPNHPHTHTVYAHEKPTATHTHGVCPTIISTWKQPQRAEPTFFPEVPATLFRLQTRSLWICRSVRERTTRDRQRGTCAVYHCNFRVSKKISLKRIRTISENVSPPNLVIITSCK